ncbi:MAG: RsmB/NOP family class I SAM-dependent RNA methyltransferase [Saprospiraceae bacterium]|nr:RsmB/NOP family class I SAM-dependent RNA methyltransferase [Saprospiraceae bacterium]
MADSDPSPTRLYPNLVAAVEQALTDTLVGRHPADKVLGRLFKANPKWGSRDRAFIAETTYDLLRYLRHYTERIGARTEWWSLIGWHLQAKGILLPDWPEWRQLPPCPVHLSDAPLAVVESVTDWLDRKGRAAYGDRWPSLLHALNRPAKVVLRINALKTGLEEARQRLAGEGIDTQPVGPWALELAERINVFQSAAFREGWFEVQDLASQQIAPLLDIKPGQRIVDACAGAGGKTLHLAALAANKGQIIALDTEAPKLAELKHRAARAGAHNIETRLIDHTRVIRRLSASADRLLLDVPCTGTGVLRRNPDTKWKLGEEVLQKCMALQHQILRQYAGICRPGGRMVYATCSILPEENQDQIRNFLAEHTGFILLLEGQFLPDDFGYDGFYYAVLERSEIKTEPEV